MSEIDKIISKYFNDDAEEIERAIAESMPLIKEAFIQVHGEECRQDIEGKFSRTKIVCPPVSFDYLYLQMINDISKYWSEKYPNYASNLIMNSGRIDFNVENLPETARQEAEVIKEKISAYEICYIKLGELSAIISEEHYRQENEAINKAISDFLRTELHYPEEMLQHVNYSLTVGFPLEALKTPCIGCELSIWDIYSILCYLSGFGIEIPKLIFHTKFYDGYTHEDLAHDIEVYNNFIESELYGKKIKDYISIDREKLDKLEKQWDTKRDNALEDINAKVTKQIYNSKYSLPNYLGYKPVHYTPGSVGAQCIPCLVQEGNSANIGNVIEICHLNVPLSNIGGIVIHELEHDEETGIVYNEDETYTLVSGWVDGYRRNIQTHENVSSSTLYTEAMEDMLFNEIINDLIALDIFEIVKGKSTSKIFESYGGCMYSNGFFILLDFYQTYKDAILRSRRQNNLEIMYETVGKENFEELKKLTKEFSVWLYESDFNYAKAVQEREAGVENEMTRVLTEIEMKRNAILAAMAEYYSSAHKSIGKVDVKILLIIVGIISVLLMLNIVIF